MITPRPARKKIVETEAEPPHAHHEETLRPLDLLVSVVADFCSFACDANEIFFKDTLMFQSRVFRFVRACVCVCVYV